jgi:hypothetical protein
VKFCVEVLKTCSGSLSFRENRVSNSHAALQSVNECLHMLRNLRAVRYKNVHMKLMGKTELVSGKAAQGRQYFSYRLK